MFLFYYQSRDYELHVTVPTHTNLCGVVVMLQQLSKITTGPHGMVCAKVGEAGPSAAANETRKRLGQKCSQVQIVYQFLQVGTRVEKVRMCQN